MSSLEVLKCWVEIVTSIIGTLAIALAWWQWKITNKLKRAEYVHQLGTMLLADKGIQEAISIINKKEHWFNSEDNLFLELGTEMKIDCMLSYYSYACYLREKKNISRAEFALFEYDLSVIANNQEIQAYFRYLRLRSKETSSLITFQPLQDYFERLLPDKY